MILFWLPIQRFRAFVAFPDYFAKNTREWWKTEIEKFYKIIDFDGLWIVRWTTVVLACISPLSCYLRHKTLSFSHWKYIFMPKYCSLFRTWTSQQILFVDQPMDVRRTTLIIHLISHVGSLKAKKSLCPQYILSRDHHWKRNQQSIYAILLSYSNVPLDVLGDVLADKTVCMSALQGDATLRHYDVHSLYGWSQSRITQP
jgi:hypothetical protein